MKKIIRLTESELRDVISKSVKRIIREDVLGDNWHEAEEEKEDSVLNNYEAFEDQKDHNWSGVGEEDIDPTYYEPHDDAIGWNDDEAEGYVDDELDPFIDNHDPTDNELYNYGNW